MELELSVLPGNCWPLFLVKDNLACRRIPTHSDNGGVVTSLVSFLPLDFFSEGNLQGCVAS
jgi:hypothetical protein